MRRASRGRGALVTTCTALYVTAAAGPAIAGDDGTTFEVAARSAQRVGQLDDVVWALTATCDAGTDVHQRQCRQLRDARATALARQPLLIEGEPAALTVGPWSAARKSVAVALTSCIACDGLTLEGRTWHVTGAPPRNEGGRLRTAALYDSARTFPDEAAATAWRAAIAAPRFELVVQIPVKRRWLVAGKEGLLLDVLAYRVSAPCTGAVVLANPPSGNVAPDPTACAAPASSVTPAPAPAG